MKKVSILIWGLVCIAVIALIGLIGYGYYQKATLEVKNPIATMEVENFGTIKMELYPDQAPEAVSTFITLANRGFYDGTKFHRIVKDFMIQTGSKDGEGTKNATLADLKDGGADEEFGIKGEFIANGVNNKIKFEKGVLGMARSDYTQYSSDLAEQSYNSGASQFFIMTEENASLNGQYTAFGKVIEGMDVVEKIENVEVTSGEEGTESTSDSTAEVSKPVNPPVVKSIKVDTMGAQYNEPHTLEAFDYMTWLTENYGLDSYQ